MKKFTSTFKKKGHEIHLITWDSGSFEGVEIHRLRGKTPKINKWLIPVTAIKVREIIKRIQPDVIHSHYLLPNTVYGALSGFHPHVASAYGSEIYLQAKKYPFISMLLRYSLARTDIVLTTSESFRQDILELGFLRDADKVIAMPWGIDVELYSRKREGEVFTLREKYQVQDNLVILNPRGIRREVGGYSQSVRALSKVVEYIPHAVLVLLKGCVSDIGYERELFALIDELGLEKNIRYIDKLLSPKEMVDVYNISDVLLSIPPSDQFSSCIQEGMACGVIPIVSRLRVYEQYLKDGKNAFFVSRNNIEEIAEKIVYCYDNPQIKDDFNRINRALIEEHEDWDKNIEKIVKLYEELVNA